MKLWGIFRFELAYQVRRPWPWLIFAALFVFTALFTRDGSLSEVQYSDFFLNSPFMIAGATVFSSVVWLLAAGAIAGEAAARDVATGMYPLTYTVRVSKAEYLGGRFLAAFALNALILLAVPAGHLFGLHAPGVHPDAIAPFRPAAYLTAYGFIALPNAFAATAIQFMLATRSGRPMAGYLGSFILFFMGFFVASLLLFKRGLGTMLDPIGIRFIVEDIAHLWSTVEKNSRLLSLDGIILQNRAIWIGIALAALTATHLGFDFAHRTETTWWKRRARRSAADPDRIGLRASSPTSVPRVARSFDLPIQLRQILAMGLDSLRSMAKSWAGLGMLIGIPLLTMVVVVDTMLSFGSPLVPTTGQVLQELTAPLASEMSRWVMIPFLTVYFAGELVWREREAGLGEITDAAPIPEWVLFLGKLLGLTFLLALFMALLMAAGMAAQAMMGHHDFEIGLYLTVLFGLQLPEYLLFAVLALVLHVLANQKYVGHLLAVVAYVIIAMAPLFGLEHDLLIYGAGPWWTYTEMSGLGPYVEAWLSFRLYWAAWALLLAVVARLLWVRGKEGGFGARLRLARQRLTRGTAATAVAATGLILGLGGFVFYNTNVLNQYVGATELVEQRAEYERRYGRYASLPQPRPTAARLHIEIYPEHRRVEIRGSYRLVNLSGVAIDSIHVATARRVETEAIAFDRPATRVLRDEKFGHQIFVLATPLQPGDSVRLGWRVKVERRGFGESGADASIVANGTLFNDHWLPAIGYQRESELILPSERREQGLPARPVIPSLYDAEARKIGGRGIEFEAVVGTTIDQIAVAPGALRRTWTEGGRRYFHYSTDGPIGSEWAFASARYEVHEARWNGAAGESAQPVTIRIYHHPAHRTHPEQMARSIQSSLDYYTRQFGPYRYGHLTVLEVPGDGVGVHADASMLTHGEGITLLRPQDERVFDLPFAVMAHEMGHQWTIPSALVEGAPVMSEGLAWYYAMKVVEHVRGKEQLRGLLRFMRQPHPIAPIYRGEPLLRGVDPYMAYRKGPLALYALSEYIGEDRVNGALRRLVENHQPAGAPLATTLDLYREMQSATPDSLRYLLHDLFEANTFWEMEVESARADSTASGAWRVTLDVRARKVVYDSAGLRREVPMDEWVPVGVFERGRDGSSALRTPLYLRMHRIRSGAQLITVTVPRRPTLAGIDPYHLLDWEEREDDDNLAEVDARVVGAG